MNGGFDLEFFSGILLKVNVKCNALCTKCWCW